MKLQKIYVFILVFIAISLIATDCYAADPKIITTIRKAFEAIEGWIIKLSTPAAAVAVGTGVFMKKFSFGDEEKIRTAKRLIRGTLFSYAFILAIDLVLAAIKTLATP